MFRKLSDNLFASPQIGLPELAEAQAMGITAIINNRPEAESEDQTPGDQIEAAARAAGMDYVAIPVTHAGFSAGQVEAMATALQNARGPVLAYCRSGTRSTLLWALAEASRGANPATLSAQAAAAGYDISPVRAMVDMLAANAGSSQGT
ncbi:MAG: TIGR01244 family sulfur transferase [Novosphingobium sp.]